MGTPVQMKWIAVVKIKKEKEAQHVQYRSELSEPKMRVLNEPLTRFIT